MSITTSSRPKRRQTVEIEILPDGSGLLFDPETAIAYPITQSAVRIWGFCDGAHEVSSMVNDLESRYLVDRSTVEADSLRLLDEFAEKRLLEESLGE